MKEVIATSHQSSLEDVVFLQTLGVCPAEVSRSVQPLIQRAAAQLQARDNGLSFRLRGGQGAAFVRSLKLLLTSQGIFVRAVA